MDMTMCIRHLQVQVLLGTYLMLMGEPNVRCPVALMAGYSVVPGTKFFALPAAPSTMTANLSVGLQMSAGARLFWGRDTAGNSPFALVSSTRVCFVLAAPSRCLSLCRILGTSSHHDPRSALGRVACFSSSCRLAIARCCVRTDG